MELETCPLSSNALLLRLPYVLSLRIISSISYLIDYKIEKGTKMSFFIKNRKGGGYTSRARGRNLSKMFFGYFSRDHFRKIHLIFSSLKISGQVWGNRHIQLGDYIPQNSRLTNLMVTSPYKCSIDRLPSSIDSLVFMYGGFIEMSKKFLTQDLPNLTRFKYEYQHSSYEIEFGEEVLNNLLSVKTLQLYYANIENLVYFLNHKDCMVQKLDIAIRGFGKNIITLLEPLKKNERLEILKIRHWSEKDEKSIELICEKFPNLRVLSIGTGYKKLSKSVFLTVIPLNLRKLKKLDYTFTVDLIDCTKPFSETYVLDETFHPSIEHLSTSISFVESNPQVQMIHEYENDFRDILGSKRRTNEKYLGRKRKVYTTNPLDFYTRFFEYYCHLKVLEIDHLGVDIIQIINNKNAGKHFQLEKLVTMILEENELKELSLNTTIRTLVLAFCNVQKLQKFWVSEELKYLEMHIFRNMYNNELSEENLMELSKNSKKIRQICFSNGDFRKCFTKQVFDSFVSNPSSSPGGLESIIYGENIIFSRDWSMLDSSMFEKFEKE